MTVYENRNAFDTSNVLFRQGQILRYSKRDRTPEMHHIDYGLSAFLARAFAARAPGEAFDLSEIQEELSRRGELAGFPAPVRFYEIGSHNDLAELEAYLIRASK